MNRIDCGTSGADVSVVKAGWGDLGLGHPWESVIGLLDPGPTPRPAQVQAFRDLRVLESRQNVIVSAPTNAGKSLVGLLILLDAIRRGGRGLLVEPLRAIAREKAEELEAIAPRLSAILGRSIAVRISTGDYRLDDETFSDPPPGEGELVIATPERVDAIMRNPEHDAWLASIAAVCVDEAHLISLPRRGPTLEHVVTSLLCMPAPARLVLLSASVGDLALARAWLSPCAVVQVSGRRPPLKKEVWELAAGEDANEGTYNFVASALDDPTSAVLVFVYQTRSAEHLAAVLTHRLARHAVPERALPYHAQMSASERERVRAAFRSGECRCVVTTTALALGVNLPATHVLVRDSVFPGVGPLSVADLLQMMGRAGRGERAGQAVVLVRPSDDRGSTQLARALREEHLPELESSFNGLQPKRAPRDRASVPDIAVVATRVAAHLVRFPESGIEEETLVRYFDRSLGAAALRPLIGQAVAWLRDPSRRLAFTDEAGRSKLTALGQSAARTMLPLHVAAGVGQLIRDVLSIDPTDRLLAGWHPLDHLIVLELLSDRSPSLRPFGAALVDQVDGWVEQEPGHASFLFREWIRGQKGASRAAELLGSLGVDCRNSSSSDDEAARRTAYLATYRAIVLAERARGQSQSDLERRWAVPTLEGIEERWRDGLLWLLSGLGQILDVRSVYAHLREECGADQERVRRVKHQLRLMRQQAWELQEDLKYCSPLGPMLRGLRRAGAGKARPLVGVQSIRLLEEAGFRSIGDLAGADVDRLVDAGVRRDLAKQIRQYVIRRLR